MKLLYLYLKDYRVLNNFHIDFSVSSNTSYALDFIVGVNGTGKSTLLRAIAEIFQRLTTRSDFSFGFEIIYQLEDNREILVSNLTSDYQNQLVDLRCRIGTDEETKVDHLSRRYLPKLIIAFTTGSERDWQFLEKINQQTTQGPEVVEGTDTPVPTYELMQTSEEKLKTLTEMYLTELPGLPARTEDEEESNGAEVQPTTDNFLFMRTTQLPLIILCGLLSDIADKYNLGTSGRLTEVLREADIHALQGFSLKFRMNTGIISREDRTFVHKLARSADQKLHLGSDYLLVYDLTYSEGPRVSHFLRQVGGGLELFKQLAKLYTPVDEEAILREINLFLERRYARSNKDRRIQNTKNVSPLHLLEWLSDGEQSFLGRLCLFTLLGGQEALILLDEPEVHFNDYWKREIVHMLDEVLQERDSHVLITSHSSITLTDVSRRSIQVLTRDSDYTQVASHPQMETLAADPSDVIVNVFGAPQATGAQSIERIKRSIQRIRRSDSEPTKQIKDLEDLLDIVGPGYWRFLVYRQLEEVRKEQRKRERQV